MGTGTPAAKRPSLHPPSGSRGRPASNEVMPRRSRSPGRPVSLFGRAAVSSSRPAQRNWRRAQGRSRTRASAPEGLVLDGLEHGASLGRSRDAGGSLHLVVGEPIGKTRTGSSSASPNRPSNTVIGAPSNNVIRLNCKPPLLRSKGRKGRKVRLQALPREGPECRRSRHECEPEIGFTTLSRHTGLDD